MEVYTLSCEEAIAFCCEAIWGFAEVDVDGKFLWCNAAYASILNAPPDLVVGTSWMAWTHVEDLDVDEGLAEKVKTGELEGYTLAKRYIQRGSTPQRQRVIWGLLSVSGKWQKTGEFAGFRVQFRPYNNLERKPRITNLRSFYTWLKREHKTVIAIIVAISSMIFSGWKTLYSVQEVQKEATQQVEQLPSGSVPPALPAP